MAFSRQESLQSKSMTSLQERGLRYRRRSRVYFCATLPLLAFFFCFCLLETITLLSKFWPLAKMRTLEKCWKIDSCKRAVVDVANFREGWTNSVMTMMMMLAQSRFHFRYSQPEGPARTATIELFELCFQATDQSLLSLFKTRVLQDSDWFAETILIRFKELQ